MTAREKPNPKSTFFGNSGSEFSRHPAPNPKGVRKPVPWKRFLGIGLLSFLTGLAAASELPRRVIALDGFWQVAEGTMDQVPEKFEHTVPVPGLVSLARPPFVEPGPVVSDRNSLAQKDPRREAFWYQRKFRLDAPIPTVAELKIGKAMFGTRVILNGHIIGDHLPSFTPGLFELGDALRHGDNELLVRVGAARQAVQPAVADGFDFEKTRYIPGIFDSVELILSGAPHIENVQVAPDLANQTLRVQAEIRNPGKEALATVRFTVREAKSGKVAAKMTNAPVEFAAGSQHVLEVQIPLPGCRPWSPEDPFLYRLEVDSGSDQVSTRFGMRTFQFDPQTRKALLNGKPYFMRGSNMTVYRFFEDPECGALPWDAKWVRLLHRRMKEMHWNCLRYCIGFPPEAWYDIADEEGILIQDEFPIWYGGPGWSKWPGGLLSDRLALEYREWIRERWNHPSVVVWDASNETSSSQTSIAVQKVRDLDLSHRPWDNSYAAERVPGDVFESHPYHFQNPKYKLADLAREDPLPQGNALRNPGNSPVIINEYGWLWLNRDGSPTTLTKVLYDNLLGTNSTTAERRHLYARYLAAETEFWRSHRQAAAVMHFTALGYSRPSGQTSDHWLNVAKLQWEPEFLKYVRDSFAPVGVIIDDWADKYEAGKSHSFSVVMLNDLDVEWKGKVSLSLFRAGKPVERHDFQASVAGLERKVLKVKLTMPLECGLYELQASLSGTPGGKVQSLRDFSLVLLEKNFENSFNPH